ESRVLGSAKTSSEDRWCGHCGKSNHNIEMCFKLHGKEKVLGRVGGFKGLSKKGTNQTVKDSEIVKDGMVLPQGEGEFSKPLSKEELERLQALMDSLNKPSSSYSGKNSSFDFASTVTIGCAKKRDSAADINPLHYKAAAEDPFRVKYRVILYAA
ncbi:hypothetical protein A2U01_0039457, partial [Trifolium medium]|nr:hypothetical protein [Trifolium medium]